MPLLQSIIELSRTQDEEVEDGTTSVIILGGSARFHSLRSAAAADVRPLSTGRRRSADYYTLSDALPRSDMGHSMRASA